MPNTPEQDVSSTLGAVIAEGYFGPEWEIAYHEGTETAFLSHTIGSPDTPAVWEVAGKALETLKKTPLELPYRGASADLCRLFFENRAHTGGHTEGLLSGAGNEPHLYELDSGCGGEPVALSLVALNNSGKLPARPAATTLALQEATPLPEKRAGSMRSPRAVGRSSSRRGWKSARLQTHIRVVEFAVRIGGARTLEVIEGRCSPPVRKSRVAAPRLLPRGRAPISWGRRATGRGCSLRRARRSGRGQG